MGETVKLDFKKKSGSKTQKITLASGRQIIAGSKGDKELLEIKEADDKLLMTVRLTDSGPVISLKGAKLELSGMEEISLDAEKINIHSKNQTRISSRGDLEIHTQKDIDIKSREDIKLKSRLIHLN